ncbi:MAG: cytochrome c5 family protein [Betaproteobacteria bacterium]|nr:cytochrome c5 family protein [Betaproteobacteria bacterium]
MAEIHVEEHASPIKTPKQLVVAVVAAFAVPIVLIVMLTQLVTVGADTSATNPALSDEAIAKRLKPVGEVAIDPSQPKPEPAPAAPVAVAAAPAPGAPAPAAAIAGAGKGKAVYDASCMACHAAGVAGAPKAGDKAAWAPRLNAGMETLYASSLKGKNAMPPKGGNLSLADADVKAAVDYLVSLVK